MIRRKLLKLPTLNYTTRCEPGYLGRWDGCLLLLSAARDTNVNYDGHGRKKHFNYLVLQVWVVTVYT